jgi:hypothetical protein
MRSKQKIAGLILLAGVLASCLPAYAEMCRTSPDKCAVARLPQRLPVKLYHNFLVVARGQFGGGQERQNFVLDTGVAPSIVNAWVVKQLGLTTTPSFSTAVGKTIPTQTAIMSELDLGPIRATSLPMQVQDLSRLERDFGIPLAGIIGLDVLSKSSFYLDYDKEEIDFGDIQHEGIPIEFDARAGTAVAELKLGGKPVRMLVDTGSDRVVFFEGNLVKMGRLALRKSSQSGTSLADHGMEVREFLAPEIILGGQHFSKDKAYLVAGTEDPVFDGLLGVRALGFRGLSYDQACVKIFLLKLGDVCGLLLLIQIIDKRPTSNLSACLDRSRNHLLA